MSREIKFRAWPHTSKEMFFPSVDDVFFMTDGSLRAHPNVTLMQFTGLKDKNGKEIYEGDVIESWSYTAEDGAHIDAERHQVWYGGQDGYPAFELKGWESECNGLAELQQSGEWEYEVIGNIYEHSHLLQGQGSHDKI